MPTTTVQDGLVVSLDYTLRLEDGEVIDQSPPHEPLQYLHGAQNIIPGLERALTGMAVDERKKVVVPPDEAYGEYDDDDIEALDRALFPPDVDLAPGEVLALRDEEGQRFNAMVIEADDDTVTLDFNHPLAGETLHFEVKVVALREATADERAHGHPHTPGMHAH